MGSRSLRSALVLIAAAACLGADRRATLKEEMRFGVEAAEHGLWREAIFRWEKFLKDHPDNARLRNNLAVAYESLGQIEQAEEQYKEAMRIEPDNKEIRENYRSFQDLYKAMQRSRAAAAATPGPGGAPGPAPTPGPETTPAPAATPGPGASPTP
ncbi:MAG TPA: tetratricopeptide repeat protein, partial [Candidatus Polarisedimenticolia bacterium]|nr:tetratricopeptide repeat protein [Candidatus Polarisedimenticolia bacterium]